MSRKFDWLTFFLLSICFADTQDTIVTPMDFCFDASYEGTGPYLLIFGIFAIVYFCVVVTGFLFCHNHNIF